jgi:hypothetical protein
VARRVGVTAPVLPLRAGGLALSGLRQIEIQIQTLADAVGDIGRLVQIDFTVVRAQQYTVPSALGRMPVEAPSAAMADMITV